MVGDGSGLGEGASVGATVSVGDRVSVGATGAVAGSVDGGTAAGEPGAVGFVWGLTTGAAVGARVGADAPVVRLQAVSPNAMMARMTRASFGIDPDGIRRLNVKLNADSILTQLFLFYTSTGGRRFRATATFTDS